MLEYLSISRVHCHQSKTSIMMNLNILCYQLLLILNIHLYFYILSNLTFKGRNSANILCIYCKWLLNVSICTAHQGAAAYSQGTAGMSRWEKTLPTDHPKLTASPILDRTWYMHKSFVSTKINKITRDTERLLNSLYFPVKVQVQLKTQK